MASLVFFNPNLKNHHEEQGQRCNFISVGGEPFHALAVALIDGLMHTTQFDEISLKKIVDRYLVHFPHALTNQTNLNPSERMMMMINSTRMSEMVNTLAYVLRQLTIDEIYSNPSSYLEAFDGCLCPDTSNAYLRQMDTPLPASSLSALTASLNINLSLYFTQHGKELRSRELFDNNGLKGPKLSLTLQVQEDQFFPKVMNKAAFTYVGHLNHVIRPVERQKDNEGTIKDKLDTIINAKKHLIMSYQQTMKSLMNVIEDRQLSKKHLIDFFIDFLPTANTPQLTQAERYLSKFEKMNGKPVSMGASCGAEQQEIKMLVNTMSAWISTNQIESDKFFEHIDKKCSQNLRRRM